MHALVYVCVCVCVHECMCVRSRKPKTDQSDTTLKECQSGYLTVLETPTPNICHQNLADVIY